MIPYAGIDKHIGDVMEQHPGEDICLVLKTSGQGIDPQRYNLPVGKDIAVIIPSKGECLTSDRDEVIYKNSQHDPDGQYLMKIDARYPMYDPLMYVLTFPFGDEGWEVGSFSSTNRQNNKCSEMMFYRFRLMIHATDTFNILYGMGRLFQQYVVDMYAKMKSDRLMFLRHNQAKL